MKKKKDLLNATYKKLINKVLNTSESVDVAHVLEVLMAHNGKCAYTGETLKIDNVSIERIDCYKGYVRGNVVLVTEPVNKTKGTTLDIFAKNDRISLEMRIKCMEKALSSLRKIKRDADEAARIEAEKKAEETKSFAIEWLHKEMTTMTAEKLAQVVTALGGKIE